MNPYWDGDEGWETEVVVINGQVYQCDNSSEVATLISELEEVQHSGTELSRMTLSPLVG